MRWLAIVAVFLCGPVLASTWSCNSALSRSDAQLGKPDLQFKLTLAANGRLSATSHRNIFGFGAWRWIGHWTDFEGQLAMIGAARTALNDPILVNPGYTSHDIRAFSTVREQNVIVMTLWRRSYPETLVRCLLEHS